VHTFEKLGDMKAGRADINEIFGHGGKESVELLDYCVRSIQVDPIFVFLVQQYRSAPTVPKAVALYDIFCVPNALARISTQNVLPPLDLRIQSSIRPFRADLTRSQVRNFSSPGTAFPRLLPPKYLFDFIAQAVQENSSAFSHIRRRYKRSRTPIENLPGGEMTSTQRHFVEKIWEPIIRPHLLAAGFWRIASIG